MQKSKTKIIYSFPPNYHDIKQYLKDIENHKPFFAYKDTIYNPFKIEIPPDIELHEQVHFRQQQDSDPDVWWMVYCTNRDFREQMEVEAYAEQYNFIKKHLPVRATDEALDEMASNLSSSLYNLDITKHQARTLIRYKAKELRR